MLEAAVLVLTMAQDRQAPKPHAVIAAAHEYIEKVRRQHPNIPIDLPQPRRKAACLPMTARVATPAGQLEIARIAVGDLVRSWSESLRRLEPRPVTHVLSAGRVPVVRIALESGGGVTATRSHTVRTERGWLRVSALRAGDRLTRIGIDGSPYQTPILAVTSAGIEDVVNLHVAGREHRSSLAGLG